MGSVTRLLQHRTVANHRQAHAGTQTCNGCHQIAGAFDRRELPRKHDQELAFTRSQPRPHRRTRLRFGGGRQR